VGSVITVRAFIFLGPGIGVTGSNWRTETPGSLGPSTGAKLFHPSQDAMGDVALSARERDRHQYLARSLPRERFTSALPGTPRITRGWDGWVDLSHGPAKSTFRSPDRAYVRNPLDPAALPGDAGDMAADRSSAGVPGTWAKPRPLSIMANRLELSVRRLRKVPATSSPAAGGANAGR
jgi:hypothetical protein